MPGDSSYRNNEVVPSKSSTCFSCRRLNPSTFLIVEDDQWGEQPFIYAKIYNHVVVLVDTGCGGAARDDAVQLRSLRRFLETYPVDDNKGSPLNPGGGKAYIVVCTHCHYDHIGEVASPTSSAQLQYYLSCIPNIVSSRQRTCIYHLTRCHRSIYRPGQVLHMGQCERQVVHPR